MKRLLIIAALLATTTAPASASGWVATTECYLNYCWSYVGPRVYDNSAKVVTVPVYVPNTNPYWGDKCRSCVDLSPSKAK